MDVLLKAGLAAVWLILFPAVIGSVFECRKETFSAAGCFVKGYLVMFTLAEILILPMIYINGSFRTLTWIYGGILCLIFGVAVFKLIKRKSDIWKNWKCIKISLFGIAAIVVIAVQIFMVMYYAHMDADDAVYVGAATTAIYTDEIYSISTYTGYPYAKIPSRYILSPFPIFLAIVSQLSGGLHPAIMAHTFLAAVLLILAYAVMFFLAKKWFEGRNEAQEIFVLCVAVINWFSAYSVYNTGMFQMIRLWQGKAVLAAVMIPLMYYLAESLLLSEHKESGNWLLLFMANMSCCLISSMGIMLSPLVIGAVSLIGLLKHRNLKRLFYSILCCIPSGILGIVYIFMK